MALNYFPYNFIKIHRTLRMTPPMAAGVTEALGRGGPGCSPGSTRAEGRKSSVRMEPIKPEQKVQKGTIFKVYLLANPGRGKQEGFIKLWKHKGAFQKTRYIPFDYFDELPKKIRKILADSKIEWPPDSK